VAADILPLLSTLTESGQAYVLSAEGLPLEARVQRILQGQAGNPVASAEELGKLIKDNTKFSTVKSKRFIRLRDTREGPRILSPLIYLDGDLSKTHPRLSVQMIIVAHTDSDAGCLLLRFETPEGGDPMGEGKHDFYHSQLCTFLRTDGPNDIFSIPNSMLWSAESCPAWPMDAKKPVHLLACVLFALYGKPEGVRLLKDAYGDTFGDQIVGMHFSFPSLFSSKSVPTPKQPRIARKKRQ